MCLLSESIKTWQEIHKIIPFQAVRFWLMHSDGICCPPLYIAPWGWSPLFTAAGGGKERGPGNNCTKKISLTVTIETSSGWRILPDSTLFHFALDREGKKKNMWRWSSFTSQSKRWELVGCYESQDEERMWYGMVEEEQGKHTAACRDKGEQGGRGRRYTSEDGCQRCFMAQWIYSDNKTK